MPEYYTFVTERMFSEDEEQIKSLEFVKEELKKAGFVIHEFSEDNFRKTKNIFLSGGGYEEDCGYPPELTLIFEGSGITCVYCNGFEYGIIRGGNWDAICDSTIAKTRGAI